MKKLIYLGFLLVIMAFLLYCAGVPEYSESREGTYSLILTQNFSGAEYQKINNQSSGLTGTWQAVDNSRNLYSEIQFDDQNNFMERVYQKLTNEIVASYEGDYKVNLDVIEIVTNKGNAYLFSFDLNSNTLQLSAK
jgi:hypothetical protein